MLILFQFGESELLVGALFLDFVQESLALFTKLGILPIPVGVEARQDVLLDGFAGCLVGGVLGLALGSVLSMVRVDLPLLPSSHIALGGREMVRSVVLALGIGVLGGGLMAGPGPDGARTATGGTDAFRGIDVPPGEAADADKALLDGPQLPENAVSQDEIDKLFS